MSTLSDRRSLRLLVALLAIIFAAELLAMVLLERTLAHAPHWLIALVDAAILTAISLPVLWYLFVRPLRFAGDAEARRIAAIMDAAADGVITIDPHGTVLSINPAAQAMFGYRRDEIVGHNLTRLMPTPESREHDAHLARYLAGGPSQVIGQRRVVRALRKDGEVFAIELSVSEVRVGALRQFVGVLRDVTLQQRSERQARESEAKFRALFEYAGDAMFLVEADGRIADANPAACARLGYSRQELQRKRVPEIDSSDSARRFRERAAQLEQGGELLFEAEHVTRDGVVIPVEIQARAFEHAGRRVVLSIARDIRERKRQERALRASEQTKRAVLDASTESVLLLDLDGRIVDINRTGASRFGRDPADVIGQHLSALMPREVAERRQAMLKQVADTGSPVQFEDTRDGMVFQTSCFPVTDAGGKVVQLAVYAANITGQRRAQAIEHLLHDIDQSVLDGHGIPEILQLACLRLTEMFGLRLAWVGRKHADGTVLLVASAGAAQAYRNELFREGLRWDGPNGAQVPACAVIRNGEPVLISDADPVFANWSAMAGGHGLRSMLGLPLRRRGEIYGVLAVYGPAADTFRSEQLATHLRDIANRLSLAVELASGHQELRLLSAALSSAGNSVFITDRSGRIQWANESFARASGWSVAELLGQTPRVIRSGRHDADYYRDLWTRILAGEVWRSETVERRKDGSLYTVLQTVTPIRDERGEVTHFVSIHEDITEKKHAEERVQYLAHHDPLTDLPNRPLFYSELEQLLRMADRNSHKVALLYLDLDRFKPVNDLLGHAAGDELLRQVAQRLRESLRASDVVARIGGDEFTVTLPYVEATDGAGVERVAAKIISAIGQPFTLAAGEVQIGVSIGIACYPADAGSADALMHAADDAMYAAKAVGRNTWRRFEPTVNPAEGGG